MPLTIRVETIRNTEYGQSSGMNFPQTKSNSNQEFIEKTIVTGLGLKAFNVAAKVGHGVNAAISAYNLNYSRQEQIDQLIFGAENAISLGLPFVMGNPVIGVANILMKTVNFASNVYFDHMQTRNENSGISNLRAVVGTVRKTNGRIGI